MLQTIDISLLEQVSGRIERRTGLHFPRERFADLERGLAKAAHEAGWGEARDYATYLLREGPTMSDVDTLAACLTIGESHFFRDRQVFAFIETAVLPALIAAKRAKDRRLRILSAGCASGEEPYSIAILLHRLMPDLHDWHITILGADINPKVLVRAAAGIYSEWSFRDTPDWVKRDYFIPLAGNRYELQPWVKRMVTFTRLNLAEDSYPADLNNTSAYDLIICRNVLIYFAPARMLEVVRRLHGALVEDGQLVLGSVEASHMTFPELTPHPANGMAMYRKKCANECGTQGAAHRVAGGHEVFAVADNLSAAAGHIAARTELLSATDSRLGDDRHATALLAQYHADLGELAEALAWCERALASSKTNAELHFLHAAILQGMDRHEETLVALRNVLFLDPGHLLAHLAAANLHRRKGRLSAAAKHVANICKTLANHGGNEGMSRSSGFTVGRLNAMLAATKGAVGGQGDHRA